MPTGAGSRRSFQKSKPTNGACLPNGFARLQTKGLIHAKTQLKDRRRYRWLDGIGLAAAKKLVEEGAHVFIVGRRQSELDKAKAKMANVTAIQADVANLDDLDRSVRPGEG